MKTTEHIPHSEAKDVHAPTSALPTHHVGRVLNVWMVDEHPATRQGLSEALNSQPGIHCIRTFASGAEVLQVLNEERPPDIILLDPTLGSERGLDFIRPIKKLAPTVSIIMFSMFKNIHFAAESFRAGASGFLLKTYDTKDIARLIRQAQGDPGSPALPVESGAPDPKPLSPLGALLQFFHFPRSGTVH